MIFLIRETEFASYADDNRQQVASDTIDDAIEIDSIRLFELFSDNQMKTKKDKCHLIVSNNKHVYINIYDIEIESSH